MKCQKNQLKAHYFVVHALHISIIGVELTPQNVDFFVTH